MHKQADGRQAFLRSVISIALPVAAQSMLQSSFSMVDQIMVGQLGAASIAAVEVASRPGFIFSFISGAVGAIAGIMISQYTGKKDDAAVGRAVSVNAAVSCVLALAFTVPALLLPAQIAGIYTGDPAVTREAAGYLRLISLTYLPLGMETILGAYVRCMGRAAYPLYAGIAASAVNTGLNWLLIFGGAGFPKLGVRGAAIASAASCWLGAALLLALFARAARAARAPLRWSLRLGRAGWRQYAAMLLPVVLNEFLWTLGQNVNTFVYGHIGTDGLAAMSLTGPVQGMFIGALSGLSQAAGILVGKRLGEQDYDAAYRESKLLCWYGLGGAVALSAALAAAGGPYVRLFRVEPAVRETAYRLLLAFALLAPAKVLNMILGGGIVRSGGRTAYIMAVDMAGTWLLGVPLALLTAFVFRMDIFWVYLILSQEEAARLAVTLWIFRRRRWMQTL